MVGLGGLLLGARWFAAAVLTAEGWARDVLGFWFGLEPKQWWTKDPALDAEVAKAAEIVVPVIDRGPYVPGRTWDLSGAACTALGHCWTGPIYWKWG